MDVNKIQQWLAQARKAGLSNEQIKSQLKTQRWEDKQIDQLLSESPPRPQSDQITYQGIGKRIFKRSWEDIKSVYKQYALFAITGGILSIALFIALLLITSSIWMFIFAYLIFWFIFAFISLAVTVIVTTHSSDLSKIFSITLKRFFPFYLTTLLGALIIVGGYMLLIVPGILMVLAFSILSFVVIRENLSGFKALKRCYILARKYRGDIMVAYLILSLFMAAGYFIGMLGALAISALISVVFPDSIIANAAGLVPALAIIILFYFFVPLFNTVYSHILYKDLSNIRPPGTDLEVGEKGKKRFIFYIVLGAILLSLIFFGIFNGIFKLSDSRSKAQDSTRKADISIIRTSIFIYKDDNGSFPNSLDKLVPDYMAYVPTDPETDLPYEYTLSSGGNSFEICAELNDTAMTEYCLTDKNGYIKK